MAYQIPEKLKKLQAYEPVTEVYKVRLDANESFIDLPDEIRKEFWKLSVRWNLTVIRTRKQRNFVSVLGEFFQVDSRLLTAGNGSDELISLIVQNFLEPGQTMLTISPDFSMYGFYAPGYRSQS